MKIPFNKRVEWENPKMYSLNSCKPHAQVIPLDSTSDAVPDNISDSAYYLSLDGEWMFKWVENLVEAPLEFQNVKWDSIKIPHCWEMDGYGHPIYVGAGYPFKPDPPSIPIEENHVGTYRKKIKIPEHWEDNVESR